MVDLYGVGLWSLQVDVVISKFLTFMVVQMHGHSDACTNLKNNVHCCQYDQEYTFSMM